VLKNKHYTKKRHAAKYIPLALSLLQHLNLWLFVLDIPFMPLQLVDSGKPFRVGASRKVASEYFLVAQ